MVSRVSKEELTFLSDDVFETSTRWPQYNLLLNKLQFYGNHARDNDKILIIERNNLYGGFSPFSIFFRGLDISLLDLSPPDLVERGAYNASRLARLFKSFETLQTKSVFDDLREVTGSYDLILIPNLIHHIPVSFHLEFFTITKSLLSEQGRLLIFEPAFREIHQSPFHFCTYTPDGIRDILTSCGYSNISIDETGSPFDAVAYALDNCKEYIGDTAMTNSFHIFSQETRSLLYELESKFGYNKIRANSRFISAFFCEAK